jgi:hypothetical protein
MTFPAPGPAPGVPTLSGATTMTIYGYPDLAKKFGWSPGVHRAPVGYGNPWLVVTRDGTIGAWSREEARRIYRDHLRGATA